MADGVKEEPFVRQVLSFMLSGVVLLLQLFEDNEEAIAVVENQP